MQLSLEQLVDPRDQLGRLVGTNQRLDWHGLDDLIGSPCYPPLPDPDPLHACHHPS